jgi:hypothetical protein
MHSTPVSLPAAPDTSIHARKGSNQWLYYAYYIFLLLSNLVSNLAYTSTAGFVLLQRCSYHKPQHKKSSEAIG